MDNKHRKVYSSLKFCMSGNMGDYYTIQCLCRENTIFYFFYTHFLFYTRFFYSIHFLSLQALVDTFSSYTHLLILDNCLSQTIISNLSKGLTEFSSLHPTELSAMASTTISNSKRRKERKKCNTLSYRSFNQKVSKVRWRGRLGASFGHFSFKCHSPMILTSARPCQLAVCSPNTVSCGICSPRSKVTVGLSVSSDSAAKTDWPLPSFVSQQLVIYTFYFLDLYFWFCFLACWFVFLPGQLIIGQISIKKSCFYCWLADCVNEIYYLLL